MANRSNDRDPADGQGHDDEADVEADEVPEDSPRAQSGRPTRARAGSSPRAGETGRSEPSSKWAIDRLDERERRFSFVASAGAVLFGVVVYLAETENSKFRLQKGQLTPQTTLIVGIAAGALLFGATLLGRRAPIGFLALFTGIAFSNSFFLLALPFLALAIWILYHSYKIQKEASAKLRAARAESRVGPTRHDPLGDRFLQSGGRLRQEGPILGTGQAGGQQALYAQAAAPAGTEALAARAQGHPYLGLTAGYPGSVTSAERSSSRISFLRRTSDRAVGSSPKARSTSTSVIIPITVE